MNDTEPTRLRTDGILYRGRVARPDALGWAWSLVNLYALRKLRACHTTGKSSVSLLNDGLESRGLGCTTTAFRFRLIRRPTKGLHFNFMKGRFWQDNEGQNDEESGVRCLPSFCPTSFCLPFRNPASRRREPTDAVTSLSDPSEV